MVPSVAVPQPLLGRVLSQGSAAAPAPVSAPSSGPVRTLDVVDNIKARSTLVALIQPTAWIGELVSTPGQTGQTLALIGKHLVSGQLGEAGSELGSMLNRAMHPTGIPHGIYMVGLWGQSGVDALVGGVEIYHGFRDNHTGLKLMGGADLIGSASSAAFALGNSSVALGLNIASNASRAALVLLRPDDYSRIQKAKTVFDGLASVSAGLLKAGIAPVPALAGYVGFGVTQIVYMNNENFRGKVDAAVDWVFDRFK